MAIDSRWCTLCSKAHGSTCPQSVDWRPPSGTLADRAEDLVIHTYEALYEDQIADRQREAAEREAVRIAEESKPSRYVYDPHLQRMRLREERS